LEGPARSPHSVNANHWLRGGVMSMPFGRWPAMAPPKPRAYPPHLAGRLPSVPGRRSRCTRVLGRWRPGRCSRRASRRRHGAGKRRGNSAIAASSVESKARQSSSRPPRPGFFMCADVHRALSSSRKPICVRRPSAQPHEKACFAIGPLGANVSLGAFQGKGAA
jgi:hypothetical protein